MLTVVGLGNPGDAYAKTRHNAGFMLLDSIVDGRFDNSVKFPITGLDISRRFLGAKPRFKKSNGPFLSIETEIDAIRCCFVKPITFMNDSGRALTSLRSRGIFRDINELLIVVDDVDLDVGHIRLRSKGAAGSHNGLKSVVQHLGTDEFNRLRIGVGPRPPGSEMIEFVLGSFKPDELPALHTSLAQSFSVVEAWITGGFEKANTVISQV